MRRRSPVAVFLFTLFFAWPASAATLGASLDFGRHCVGFEQLQGVSIWYPCASATGSAMTLQDYSSDRGSGLTEFMASTGISRPAIERYLSAPMRARRGATPRRRASPLVLLAVGNAQDVLDHAVLAEYLASHGYVVAATASPMLRKPMKSADEIPAFAEEHGMRHAHFTSIGFGAVIVPEIAQVTKAPEDIDRLLRNVAASALEFVRQHD